jgi:3-deoxy-7-phosphoheptulonate synthase
MKDISANDIQNNFPLVTRQDYVRDVKVGNVVLGGKDIVLMAGPCTVEGKTQIMDIAQAVKEAGAHVLRGGVFKPLTFPYGDPLVQPDSDSGEPKRDRKTVLTKAEQYKAAEKRFKYLKDAGEKHGLPVISEIIYADSMPMLEEYVDMYQVGYRHMFNMDLIDALSRSKKPIMLKRHYGESLRSLLGVAEHFEARNKHNFVFCERGVSVPHTHETNARAIMDVQAFPALKHYAPSVPVFADPSHATFNRDFVPPMSRAAIAAGASGLLIEVHSDPQNAWVDPLQALTYKNFASLVSQLNKIRKIVVEA